jgi:hypothetical protein
MASPHESKEFGHSSTSISVRCWADRVRRVGGGGVVGSVT